MWGAASRTTETKVRGRPVGASASSLDSFDDRFIGRYLVIEALGQGGMGMVLRAYDPKLEREVAIKLMRSELLTAEADEMVIREARAMAKLSHPNVVEVFDVGALRDRGLMVAMEYVRGGTLGEWVQARERSYEDVLARFVEAGRGLAAAHAAGLLHRDFKPANVLLTAEGAVKVGDFGLCAETSNVASDVASNGGLGVVGDVSGDGDRSGRTEADVVVGTPRYMGPEHLRGDPLTDAADQYSFCLALWEALALAPPFADADHVRAKQAGPPPWPKAVRVPRKIAAAVRRGLAPAPEDRWPSMTALLKALERDPARKKRRWAVGLASIGVLLAAAGAWFASARVGASRCTGASEQLASVWDDNRRDQVRDAFLGTGVGFASNAWDSVGARLDDYAEKWRSTYTEACEVSERGSTRDVTTDQQLDLQMGCLRTAKMQLGAVVTVFEDADAEVVEKAQKVVGTLAPLDRCADLDALAAEVPPPAPEDAAVVDAIRGRLAEARALRSAGKYDAAQAALDEIEGAAEAIAYEPIRGRFEVERGEVAGERGDHVASAAAYREALRLGLRWGDWAPATQAAIQLAYVAGYVHARSADGHAYAKIAEGLLASRGDTALGDTRAHLLQNEAIVLMREGRYAEAEAEFRGVLRLRQKIAGPRHEVVATSHNNLGNALYARGDYPEAEREHRKALDIRLAVLGSEHPDLVMSYTNLGGTLSAQGKLAEAETVQREALRLQSSALGPGHPGTATAHNNLGSTLLSQSKFEEAAAQLEVAIRLIGDASGPDHLNLIVPHTNLGDLRRRQGRLEEAEADLREALRICEQLLPLEHPDTVSSRAALGIVLMERGDPTTARAMLEEAWRVHQGPEVQPAVRAVTAFALARARWEAGDRAEAIRLARLADASFEAAGDLYAEQAGEVRTWLRAHA